jgi:1-acyl-sn-glycerol-3-phosphate acyltransferase
MNPRLHQYMGEALLRSTAGFLTSRFWRVTVLDTPHFPMPGPCFLYGNHANNFDPFLLNMPLPWGEATAGVLTQEFMRKGLVAWAFRGLGLLPTRKRVPEPHLIRALYRLLEQGRRILIYPEGGRRWAGRPMPWIEATAKLFARAGVPVYPIRTHGSYVAWPRWADYPRPARLRIEVLPPLQFAAGTPFAEALRQLQAPLDFDENRVPEAVRPRRAWRPAAGLHRLLYRDPDTGAFDALHTPDGTGVDNRAGTIRWRMRPDSTLHDERTGESYLTGDLYDRIRVLPLETHSDGALFSHQVEVHEERQFPHLRPCGVAEATLFPDAVRLTSLEGTQTIGLETIQYTGIERNFKLQLTLDDRMVQLAFRFGGSALGWEDTLQRLAPHLALLPPPHSPPA